jgi:NADPH:quinone reductase-like Zn-dependent oxidoreductase
MKLFEDGTLKVIIHSTFKYSQIAEAMKIVEDNQAVGKVVLENDL